jgi:hypothetical protein
MGTHGFPLAERRTLTGAYDKGDVSGVPARVFEVKNVRRDCLPGWVDEAVIEAQNVSSTTIGMVVHKRVGTTDPGRWFVTMTLADYCRMEGET